tara:strand:- start:2226 stop:2561 length:336 start_codon:yes stop_codon:yes gene_type:complete
MVNCSFCKKNYHEHKGLVLFTNEGRTVNYCSSKCRRNDDLGRDSKKVNWVKRDKKVKDFSRKTEKINVKKEEKVVKKEDKVEKKVEEKVEKSDKKEVKKVEGQKSGKSADK